MKLFQVKATNFNTADTSKLRILCKYPRNFTCSLCRTHSLYSNSEDQLTESALFAAQDILIMLWGTSLSRHHHYTRRRVL